MQQYVAIHPNNMSLKQNSNSTSINNSGTQAYQQVVHDY